MTEDLMVISLLLGVFGDVFLYFSGRETISQVIWRWSQNYPMVPFVAGLLMGHWFW